MIGAGAERASAEPARSSRDCLPRATYRLQLHRGFTLRQLNGFVGYFHDLGISHLYLSPLLKARSGSAHGYDLCDPTRLNPEIGTEGELESLVALLRRKGMGLVLDIVPNHMAAGAENPWWWDVLANGRESAYAACFDIHWDSPDPRLHNKLLLPVLGEPYAHALAQRQFRVNLEGTTLVLQYFEQRFPLAPDSLDGASAQLPKLVGKLNGDPRALDALLGRQHYRLAWWRLGDSQLNYRRFFNISFLVGLRVENEHVFDLTHERIVAWYRRGLLDGLRVDHPDGLRDPQAYLQRLRQAAPAAWIVVEKILAEEEPLPEDWPVAGTTGYEFMNWLGGLFVDPAGEGPLTACYARFTGEPTDFAAIVHDQKRHVLLELLAAEVERLVDLLCGLAARHWRDWEIRRAEVRQAVVELAACFPVYRTYVRPAEGPDSAADAIINQAVASAEAKRAEIDPALFEFLGELLRVRLQGEVEADFVARFQQLTGPAMAKGLEDTAFYRFNRLLSLNEVGGNPSRFGVSLAAFHQFCAARQRRWPEAMNATSTHDTKRSEDVRARLSLLSEIPDQWAEAVERWSKINQRHRRGVWPDANAEYLLYQTVCGAWPLSLERAQAFMEKAAQEAKEHTSWSQPNAAYLQALRQFVEGALGDAEFISDLERFVDRLREPGQLNSITQTLIKLTAPGVPDIYQGTELWDLSLVDPDNRRPVDLAVRQRLLAELAALSPETVWRRREEGLPKLWVIVKTLQYRRRCPEIFGAKGDYQAVPAEGAKAGHVIAFMRAQASVTVAPRLVLGLAGGWSDTTIQLPAGRWTNELTGAAQTGGVVRLAELLTSFPVALLSLGGQA